MTKNILWIDDDAYFYLSLFRPLEKKEVNVDWIQTLEEAYAAAQRWKKYDLIVVDIILRVRHSAGKLPEAVEKWTQEAYGGIGLLKWLRQDLKVTRPIVILSVIDNPIETYGLQDLGIAEAIPKKGIIAAEFASRLEVWLAK